MKKIIAAALLAGSLFTFGACANQADRAQYNVSQDAENFKVIRRLAVINTITGQPTFEMVGAFSIDVDEAENQLEVTAKVENGLFKKHFIGIGPTVTYVVEDVSGADVSGYRYQVNYMPESIIPIEFKRGS